MKIQKLQKARELRRKLQAEEKYKMSLMDEEERVRVDYQRMIQQFKRTMKKKDSDSSHNEPRTQESTDKIMVCIRKRPLGSVESEGDAFDVVTVPEHTPSGRAGGRKVYLHEPKIKLDRSRTMEHHEFKFDRVFGEAESNLCVYTEMAQPLVYDVFEGGMSTLFAYGQTGSGKVCPTLVYLFRLDLTYNNV
jgi:hypothetical protein